MFRELLRCRGLAILMMLLLEGFHISCLCLFLLLFGGHDIRRSSVHVFWDCSEGSSGRTFKLLYVS